MPSNNSKQPILAVGWRPGPWGKAVGLSRATVYTLLNQRAIQAKKSGAATLITTQPDDYIASLPTYDPQSK